MFRSMYQQQVGPEHGYTTYIMRSLRSPPAQKVPTQLGKLEIKIWKLLKSHISVIMQELQDGWSPKDLTSAVSSLCQFCTHRTLVRNTKIHIDRISITNETINFHYKLVQQIQAKQIQFTIFNDRLVKRTQISFFAFCAPTLPLPTRLW